MHKKLAYHINNLIRLFLYDDTLISKEASMRV